MADDLFILISGKLNEEASKTNINTQIKKLESKLEKINLKVTIDDKVLTSLNNFSKSMEKFKSVTSDANKILKEEQNIIKQTDGTIQKITKQYLKNGEVIEKIKNITNKAKQDTINNTQKEQSSIKKVNIELGEQIKLVRKLNAEQKEISKTTTYRTKPGQTVAVTQKAGDLTSYKVVDDTEKLKKAELKAQEEIRNAILQTEQNRRKEIEKSAQQQAKAANKAKEDAYKQAEAEKKKTEELEHQLQLYRQQAQINANNLRRRYGDNVDERALGGYLNSVRELNTSMPDLNRRMDNLNMSFREISSNVRTSSSHVLSFGEALRIAMVRFPI